MYYQLLRNLCSFLTISAILTYPDGRIAEHLFHTLRFLGIKDLPWMVSRSGFLLDAIVRCGVVQLSKQIGFVFAIIERV